MEKLITDGGRHSSPYGTREKNYRSIFLRGVISWTWRVINRGKLVTTKSLWMLDLSKTGTTSQSDFGDPTKLARGTTAWYMTGNPRSELEVAKTNIFSY